MPFSRHTRRSVFSIGAASLAAAFLFLTPENTHAADTTAKIHILTLDSGSNAIVLESVDDNGQKIFGMVDSGEDWDYPDGSDPRYPLRSGITTSTGYDDEVLSYLDSLGVTSDNLQFMLQHIRTATILEPAIPSCGCIPPTGFICSRMMTVISIILRVSGTIFMSTTSFLLL